MTRKTTVLIVDDSTYVTNCWAAIIRKFKDIEVIGTAKNGEDALDFLKEVQPDVVLLDVIMPKNRP